MATLQVQGSEMMEPRASPSHFPLESLQSMEDGTLQELLEQTQRNTEALLKENEMFEKFLKRLDPKDVQIKVIAASPSSQLDMRMQRKKTKMKASSSAERILKLTVEQKCDIATRELDELRDELQRKKEEEERALDNHRAVVGEADLRLAEMKKLEYEFDRDLVRGAINPRTGNILGEKVIRYFEDRLRTRDTLIEKLRLKNSSLRVKKSKLQVQLKQKEEAGEVRHEVDFEQLKIESQQYQERRDEKNQELLKLKLSAGNTTQVLNSYKKKLHQLSVESKQLDSEIGQRGDLLDKIKAETRIVEKEKSTAEELNAEARRKLEDYRVPDVMEYVNERAGLYELTKTVRAWERKVEIAEMALRTHRQTWRRMCQQSRRAAEQAHARSRTMEPFQTALY